jgi:hypothetical protein
VQAVIAPKGSADAQRRLDEGARAASSLSASALQAPEQWLQGIADLRKQGRHEDADKELAEFRKRYPEYRIAPEMREKVEKPAWHGRALPRQRAEHVGALALCRWLGSALQLFVFDLPRIRRFRGQSRLEGRIRGLACRAR